MSSGNGVLSSLFGAAPAPARLPVKRDATEARIENTLTEWSLEAIQNSPNFHKVGNQWHGVITVTPKLAKQMLENKNNVRNVQEPRVLLYAECIEKGQWDNNGETMKFDANLNQLDGQHRSEACVLAEKPFVCSIVVGVESAVNVDRGKPRAVDQVISAMGFATNAKIMSAMINFLHAYNDAGSKGFVTVGHGKHPFTMDDKVAFCEANAEELNDSIQVTARTKKFNKPALHAALHYIFAKTAGKALADEFYNKLIDGTGLESDDPIWHLRERLQDERRTGKAPQINPYAGLIIKGWNYYITGQKVRLFKYNFKNEGIAPIKRSPVKR